MTILYRKKLTTYSRYLLARNVGLVILSRAIGTMLIHYGYEKTADINNFPVAVVGPIGFLVP